MLNLRVLTYIENDSHLYSTLTMGKTEKGVSDFLSELHEQGIADADITVAYTMIPYLVTVKPMVLERNAEILRTESFIVSAFVTWREK